MLISLAIRHYALIERLELDLYGGMTAITGETGAGKSIILGALSLALGKRAEVAQVIHSDAQQCEVSALFEISKHSALRAWLEEHSLTSDGECILRRVIHREGRSKCYINGQPVTVSQLQELGTMLVSIHGQHQHQALQRSDEQRERLDSVGEHHKLLEKVNEYYRTWHSAKQRLTELTTGDDSTKKEFLNYQLEEFEKLELQEDEIENLDREHRQLANLDKLQSRCQTALAIISEDPETNLSQLITLAITSLQSASQYHEKISEVIELLGQATIAIDEAGNELSSIFSRMDADPERLTQIDQRLSQLHQLARKHQCKPEQLIEKQRELQETLDNMNNQDEIIQTLENTMEDASASYSEAAKQLTKTRKKTAKRLSQSITAHCQSLGMPGSQFKVALETLENTLPNRHGNEKIKFMVSTNPGQPLVPLSKVASGGELSRISLSIEVETHAAQTTPALIFDEVDTGIGGSTAEIVGRLLKELGSSHQIFCVTHLPQVASLAHQHLRVSKWIEAKQTHTKIEPLSDTARVEEIARMIGGVNITKQTRELAREMSLAVE